MPEQLEFDYDVFISYSSHDKEWVRGVLLKGIEKAGLRAFVDFRDFTRGAPSIKEMERGVFKCRKILLVLTRDYIKSEWCELEAIMAQTLSPANRDLRLIPLLKAKCDKPLYIGALTHIDFTDNADFDLAWHQLLNALDVQPAQSAEKGVPIEIQAELDRAKAFTDGDKYSEAIPILEKALTAADSSDHNVARVKVRLSLARALFEAREDFLGAEQLYRDALVLVPVENLDLKHGVLNGLGVMLLCSGRIDEAKATIDAALNVAKLSGKTDDLVDSLISLSVLERDLGFHESALAKLDEAIHLLHQHALSLPDDQKKDHAGGLAICYINKGQLYQDAGNLEEALAFLGKAEEQYRISGDKLNAGKALLFCGEVYCANADWEKGFKHFQRAMELFLETTNPLWMARAAEHISRLYATYENWEEAMKAMLAAASGAEEAEHLGEQVHFLCKAAKLARKWKQYTMSENALREIRKIHNNTPDEKKEAAVADLTVEAHETRSAIDKSVREDKEINNLLNRAKEIAQREHLHQHLANCLLDEAHDVAPPDDTEARHNLIAQAIELLKEELREVQSSKHRAQLMARISGLYEGLGERPEALSWLKRSGEVFEKSGDAFGLANYYATLGEMHGAEGQLDDEIAAFRKALSIIEGRSFHYLAAGLRIDLAGGLRYRGGFEEALHLLKEAEALSNKHHFNDFLRAIARVRERIVDDVDARQAPQRTFPQLLRYLHEAVIYHPELAVAYLQLWYYTWKTHLLALIRSGPNLSFMVVTDDVKRFMKFATKFRHLANYFLMTTTCTPMVKVQAGVIPIPPKWVFPPTFRFLVMKRGTTESGAMEQRVQKDDDDAPIIHWTPGTEDTPYALADLGVRALKGGLLPQEAIDLMINRPIKELIQRRAIWFPTERHASTDPFWIDLMYGRNCGVFPVYFDQLPTSDAATVCGGVEMTIPAKFLRTAHPSIAAKWKRALLRVTMLPKEEAQLALLDLPGVFGDAEDHDADSIKIEIRLFEFNEVDRQIVYPALLVQE